MYSLIDGVALFARCLIAIILLQLCDAQTIDDDTPLTYTTEFPIVTTALHFANLSKLVYYMKSCDDASHLLPSNVQCHIYRHTKADAKVMVVSSDSLKYVAVCFTGTDSVKDAFDDMELLMTPYGPQNAPIIKDAKVHKGFNEQVFSYGLYDDIQHTVAGIVHKFPDYKIVTTGHSLGGANSILAGAALALSLTDYNVESISFGSPATGNINWKEYVNKIENYGIWRVVYEDDIIARLPGPLYYHVGHTLQLYRTCAKAYFLHYGSKSLGYAGVPKTWAVSSWIIPFSTFHHFINNYYKFLRVKSAKDAESFWVNKFVSIGEDEDNVNHLNGEDDQIFDMYPHNVS